MKKRIIALMTALILVMSCMPLPVFAAEKADTSASDTAAVYEADDGADDFARYGTDGEYAIVPCHAGSSSMDSGNGSEFKIWRTHRMNNQRWIIGKVGDYYYFKTKAGGKVVDVPHSKAANDQTLQCFDYHGSDNQLWRLENMGDGTYSIHSKLNDAMVMDVKGESRDNGTAVMLYQQSRRYNQRFRFVHVSNTEPVNEWGSVRQDCYGKDWSVWDGSLSYDWYYNHKNENDLYINTAADLHGLASLVVNNNNMAGKTIHLTRDINLAGIHWTPIGFNNRWFNGSFNGHNHAIIGLSNTNSDDYCGLFGMVAGGSICNLAVKGTVKGDDHVGGICGILQHGHLVNVYSEVKINNCTDVREGGLCGAIANGGFVYRCTQNAAVHSTDFDNARGGIAGYSDGCIRYCVNNAAISHNWDYVGGIAGESGSGIFEYCANHGTVSGGGSAEYNGGIVGGMKGNGIIFGCYNDGTVVTNDNDYVGGICGKPAQDKVVIGCINFGKVSGDDSVGGIVGFGNAYKCFNAGIVAGDDDIGAIGGESEVAIGSFAYAYTCPVVCGKNVNACPWVGAGDVLSGKICLELNKGFDCSSFYGVNAPFSQNIGSDPYPTFGSSEVSQSGGSFVNKEYCVRVECDRSYGSVEGAGTYQSGAVTLKAKPAAGCVFDRFEVKSAAGGTMKGYDGTERGAPVEKIQTYKEDTIQLTDNITKSYTVRAVFKVFDDTPDDMRVTAKLELECTDDADGWNSVTIPVELVDSAGEHHRWQTNRDELNKEGAKVTHTFNLGAASPVAVYVYPNFGGGLTFHDYGLKARLWVNEDASAMESAEVTMHSYPFVSSVYGDDYMHFSFGNFGNSTLGKDHFTKCTDAWESACKVGGTIVLKGSWLLDSVLKLENGMNITIDLNGYPIMRTAKKTAKNGELFEIAGGAMLTIIDSAPSRKSCGNFTGGSIQGGRSDDTGGLIECRGTLVMNGGTLYNGGTTDKGGAIKLSGAAIAKLNGVLISDCWTDKAVMYQNEGGAIYMRDSAKVNMKDCVVRNCRALDYGGAIYMEDESNKLTCENVDISMCSATENQGGGIYQDYGETNWIGGSIVNCHAGDDDGGGIFVNNGKTNLKNIRFESNTARANGGAFYSDTRNGVWFFGCTFFRNTAENAGGAVYVYNNNVYMEDCSVIANTSTDDGGGIYIARTCTLGIAGKTVIRGNDGTGSFDNLVLENNAYLYNHGLQPGSEIHLCSDTEGGAKLSGTQMSEYQLKEYFRADYGKLSLTDTQKVNTELRASVFSEGKTAFIIGTVAVVLALIVGTIVYKRRKKEVRNEKDN